jgi:peptidoglycan/xylan/chitin deacetylase (PgdA/CDA1 family)
MSKMRVSLLSLITLLSTFGALPTVAQSSSCNKTAYLTFDTGNMAVAQYIAQVLQQNKIKATFFLANEKTKQGGYSLDDSWKTYWQERVKEGHRFGSHTYDHSYWVKDVGESDVILRPQFGNKAGKAMRFNQAELCTEINRVGKRFQELTGKPIDPIWRAPGGKTSERLIAMGEQCGYKHIGWSPSGFLGDELDSKRFPNHALLDKASKGLKNGDIAIAHLGIWSREDPWAPAVLEPLIENWKKRGFCFALIPN